MTTSLDKQRYSYRPAMGSQPAPERANPRISAEAIQLINELAVARLNANIKYEQLQEAVQESSGSVGNFLHLRSDPSLSRFLKFCDALGMDVVLKPRGNTQEEVTA